MTMAAVVWRPLTIPVRVHHSDGHTNECSNVLYLESLSCLVSGSCRQLHTCEPLSHIPNCDIAGARMGKSFSGRTYGLCLIDC